MFTIAENNKMNCVADIRAELAQKSLSFIIDRMAVKEINKNKVDWELIHGGS